MTNQDNLNNVETLEEKIEETSKKTSGEKKKRKIKARVADGLGTIIYSVPVGICLDYMSGVTTLTGLMSSRTTATAINGPAGTLYGLAREKASKWLNTREVEDGVSNALEKVSKLTEKATKKWKNNTVLQGIHLYVGNTEKRKEDYKTIKRYTADLIAFNLSQTPIYMGIALTGETGDFLNNYLPGKEASFNPQVLMNAAKNVVAASPIISPTMGWSMDKIRNLVGVESATETPYSKTTQ